MTYAAVAERRSATRRPVPLAASIRPAAGGPLTPTHSVDLSVDGVLLSCVGFSGRVVVGLSVPGTGRLRLDGVVTRQEPGRTAVQFRDLSPSDRRHLASIVDA